MIAVTGASGRLGSRIAARLEKAGVKQRLIVRDGTRAPKLKDAEVAVVSSFGHLPTMKTALAGVGTLFLVSAQDNMGVNQQAAKNGLTLPAYDRLKEHINAIDAAKAAGVKQVIYLSFLNAAEDAVFVLSRDHFHTEEYIRKSGLNFTFMRPCLYMENVPLRVSPEGIIKAPAGNGKAAWVMRDDIADVTTAVLLGEGHNGKTYNVTGPEALTIADTAGKISAACGKPVKYVSITPEETRLKHNASGMEAFEKERRDLTGRGLEDFEVEIWTTHYTQIAAGALDVVSDAIPELTGHKAQSLDEYLRQYPESYKHIK